MFEQTFDPCFAKASGLKNAMTSGITLPSNPWQLEILQMPLNTTHEDIKNQFTKYGTISRIGFVFKCSDNSLNCYLSYERESDSLNAVKENGKIVGNNSISVTKMSTDAEADKGNKRLRTEDTSDGWGSTAATTKDDAGGWGTSNTNTTSSWGSSPQSGGGRGRGGGGRGGGGGGGRSCFNCGDEGHMSRECTKPKTGRGGSNGGSRACFKCGEEGHMSRECPKGGGGGGRSCFNCNEEGHMSRECPKPRAERGRGRGRGGGGRGGGSDSYTNSSSSEWETGGTTASTQSAVSWD